MIVLNKTNLMVVMRVTSCAWIDHFNICRCKERQEACRTPPLKRYPLYHKWRKSTSDYKTSVHVLSGIERGTATQSRRLCYAPMVLRSPRKQFDLAFAVFTELVRQTNKVCRIANIDAVCGRRSCIWPVGVHCFGNFQIHVSSNG